MNSQFSQRVSDILTYSKEEANRLRNSVIGPEHLLLGILRDGSGKAMEVLMKLDADVNQIKRNLEENMEAEDDLLPEAEIPLSLTATRILKICILEARLLKSEQADTEHLLLAILKDGNNMAATVLMDNGITYQDVYDVLTMKSANPNAGMGFTEDDDEEEEVGPRPFALRTGKRAWQYGQFVCLGTDGYAPPCQRHARARQFRYRHHPCRRRRQAGPRCGPRTRD